MKLYKHTCCVCKTVFYSHIDREYFCSKECKHHYAAQRTHRQRENLETVFNNTMQEYYAYCEKNGFITYGKYKAMKTAEALKQTKGG